MERRWLYIVRDTEQAGDSIVAIAVPELSGARGASSRRRLDRHY
jgi:hypothetical protein